MPALLIRMSKPPSVAIGSDSLFPLRVVGDVQFDKAGLCACFCKPSGSFLAEIGENVMATANFGSEDTAPNKVIEE